MGGENTGRQERQKNAVQTVAELFKEARAEVIEPGERFNGNIPCVITKCGQDVYYHLLSVSIYNMKSNSYDSIDTSDEMLREFAVEVKARGGWSILSDDHGEPLGARFHDVWITPDGKVVRTRQSVSSTWHVCASSRRMSSVSR